MQSVRDEDTTENEEIDFSWSKKGQTCLLYSTFQFTERTRQSNIIFSERNPPSPLAYFKFFFDDLFCKKIVMESNLYGSQLSVYLNLETNEFDAFLETFIIMSFHCLPK